MSCRKCCFYFSMEKRYAVLLDIAELVGLGKIREIFFSLTLKSCVSFTLLCICSDIINHTIEYAPVENQAICVISETQKNEIK